MKKTLALVVAMVMVFALAAPALAITGYTLPASSAVSAYGGLQFGFVDAYSGLTVLNIRDTISNKAYTNRETLYWKLNYTVLPIDTVSALAPSDYNAPAAYLESDVVVFDERTVDTYYVSKYSVSQVSERTAGTVIDETNGAYVTRTVIDSSSSYPYAQYATYSDGSYNYRSMLAAMVCDVFFSASSTANLKDNGTNYYSAYSTTQSVSGYTNRLVGRSASREYVMIGSGVVDATANGTVAVKVLGDYTSPKFKSFSSVTISDLAGETYSVGGSSSMYVLSASDDGSTTTYTLTLTPENANYSSVEKIVFRTDDASTVSTATNNIKDIRVYRKVAGYASSQPYTVSYYQAISSGVETTVVNPEFIPVNAYVSGAASAATVTVDTTMAGTWTTATSLVYNLTANTLYWMDSTSAPVMYRSLTTTLTTLNTGYLDESTIFPDATGWTAGSNYGYGTATVAANGAGVLTSTNYGYNATQVAGMGATSYMMYVDASGNEYIFSDSPNAAVTNGTTQVTQGVLRSGDTGYAAMNAVFQQVSTLCNFVYAQTGILVPGHFAMALTDYYGDDEEPVYLYTAAITIPDEVVVPPQTGDAATSVGFVMIAAAVVAAVAVAYRKIKA